MSRSVWGSESSHYPSSLLGILPSVGATSSLNLPRLFVFPPLRSVSSAHSTPSVFLLFSLLQAKVKLILFHNFLSAKFFPQRLPSMARCLKDVIKVKTKWIPVSDKVNNVFFFFYFILTDIYGKVRGNISFNKASYGFIFPPLWIWIRCRCLGWLSTLGTNTGSF